MGEDEKTVFHVSEERFVAGCGGEGYVLEELKRYLFELFEGLEADFAEDVGVGEDEAFEEAIDEGFVLELHVFEVFVDFVGPKFVGEELHGFDRGDEEKIF